MAETFPRSKLETDRLYYSVPTRQWFSTPDGIGCFWFDTREEAMEQTEAFGQPIIHLDRALADH